MDYNEQQLRNMMRDEIRRNDNQSRFTLQAIQNHTHNGVDSKRIFQPTLTYVGLIQQDASIALLPQGWTCSKTVGGTYTIVHNLGSQQGSSSNGFSSLYSVVAQAQGASPLMSLVEEFENQFTVDWQSGDGTPFNTAFSFILTIINNHSIQNPIYTGTLISQ